MFLASFLPRYGQRSRFCLFESPMVNESTCQRITAFIAYGENFSSPENFPCTRIWLKLEKGVSELGPWQILIMNPATGQLIQQFNTKDLSGFGCEALNRGHCVTGALTSIRQKTTQAFGVTPNIHPSWLSIKDDSVI